MILALETAGPTTRMWLTPAGHRPALAPTLEWVSGRDLADQLLGVIIRELRQVNLELSDLSGLIIFSGPGSFTSLRIGHTVLNALADGLKIPIVGARGDDWLKTGYQALAQARPGQVMTPFYGADAHITRPKA